MTRFRAILAMFFIMVILDVASTHLALSLGLAEMHPLWAAIISQGGLGLHLFTKLAIAGLIILVIRKLAPQTRQLPVLIALTIGMECVVAWNCVMIASL